MDPEAALDRAEEAIKDNDKREAKDALRDYANWRARGGFQPPGGDARAKRIDRAILNFGKGSDRHVSPGRTASASGPKFRGLGSDAGPVKARPPYGDRGRTGYWGGRHSFGKGGRFYVRLVPLDRGGYANKGRDYFGGGPPLYSVESEDADVMFHIRASSRPAAIDEVHRMYPDAKVRA